MSGTVNLGYAKDVHGTEYRLEMLHSAGECFIYIVDENGEADSENLVEFDMFVRDDEGVFHPKDFLLYNWICNAADALKGKE